MSEVNSMRQVVIFSGSAHPELASEVCDYLKVDLSTTTIRRFSNDCLYVQLNANCRERDVFVIQPLVPPVQEHLMELLLMLDAPRGASSARSSAGSCSTSWGSAAVVLTTTTSAWAGC